MSYLNNLKAATNGTYTENGSPAYQSTLTPLYDLFAEGGAYRERSDADCITLFKKAYVDNPIYALKCLFYLRDILEGQGERRFFRVCARWLAENEPDAFLRNIEYVPEFGRWDDLWHICFGTPCESAMIEMIRKQLHLDIDCKTPSLLGKWMPSINTSSKETRVYAQRFCCGFNLTQKQYRKMLSELRSRINVLEKLMSAGEWDKIEFDKIPSKAGLKYRNAFARRDILKKKYETFAKDKGTKVNAKALYPYEVVHEAMGIRVEDLNELDRLAINKYWDNLTDWIQKGVFNGIAMVDVSGSMYDRPLEVALSLGIYCAERAQGPFHNHFLTFSAKPELVEFEGVDFVDKIRRATGAFWGMNTNIEAAFDLLLNTAVQNHTPANEIPETLIIISDMEFDYAQETWGEDYVPQWTQTASETAVQKWAAYGYKMPKLIFWNVNARHEAFPMKDKDGITFVSGFSPVLFQQIIEGKTTQGLMYDKLDSERYANIY